MANFDTGLLGFSPDDEEKYKEYMIRSLRPDMYDRTQQVGGVDLDWLNQMQNSMPEQQEQPEANKIGQPTEAEKPQVAQQQPVQGLLGKIPGSPQQEQQEVEVQESPGVVVQNNAEGLAHGGAASGGAAEMASSAKAADADAKAAGQQLEAKKNSMMAETQQMALSEQRRKEQEEQDLFSSIFGMGMQLLPYFL